MAAQPQATFTSKAYYHRQIGILVTGPTMVVQPYSL
jgi:hypothetical protein